MSNYLRHIIQRSFDAQSPTRVMPRLGSAYETSATGADPFDTPDGGASFSVGELTGTYRNARADHGDSSVTQPGSTAHKDAPVSPTAPLELRSVRDQADEADMTAGNTMQTGVSKCRTGSTSLSEAAHSRSVERGADSVAPADENTVAPPSDAARAAPEPVPAMPPGPAAAESAGADQAPAVAVNPVVVERYAYAPHVRPPAIPGSAVRQRVDAGAGGERRAPSVSGPEQVTRSTVSHAGKRLDRDGIRPADSTELGPDNNSAPNAGRLTAAALSTEPAQSRPDGQNSVTINIDRIEIRALHPPAPRTPAARPQLQPPQLSLQDYLKQRNGGGVE